MQFVEGNHVFGLLKQNLPVDTKVVMGRTNDDHIDMKSGTILGKTVEHICDFYIVLLDEPYPDGTKAITLPESCISPIGGN